jgi:type III secretory pathway component EscT
VNELADYLERPELGRTLGILALVMARVAPLAWLAPFVGLRTASPTIRGALIVVLTVAFAPLAYASARPEALEGPFVLVLLRESMIGSVFALVASVPFFGLESGGRLVDLYRGANLAEVIAPPTGERTSPYGDFALLAGLALFASLGGVRVAMAAFGEGLVHLPVGASPTSSLGVIALEAASTLTWALVFAAAVAMPAAIAIVVADTALGLVSRAIPRISVFFLGMPLRAMLGLVLGLASIGLVLEHAVSVSRESVDVARRLLEGNP